MFKDIKTTVTVVIGAIAYLINQVTGVTIPSDAIIAITLFVVGLLARDSTPVEVK